MEIEAKGKGDFGLLFEIFFSQNGSLDFFDRIVWLGSIWLGFALLDLQKIARLRLGWYSCARDLLD